MATFLLRYGEIALKGSNRQFFLDTLVRNVRRALEGLPGADVRLTFGRVIVDVAADPAEAAARLGKVFGVVSFSPVQVVAPDLDAITAAAVAAAGQARARRPIRTFKVDTHRADKRFPLTSVETNRHVGEAVRRADPELAVQLDNPDLVIRIEIRERAYLTTEILPGPGGLPVGTGGTALALISGGIDSPVAAWLGARRGLTVIAVHFYSFPFTSERSREKVVDLCRLLAEYTGPLPLWVVFFTEIQRAVQRQVPDPLRVVVMRRMMMRIASVLARREDALALITGESLGQVASQTLEALAAIDAAADVPVLRPLIGADKSEIVARARAIGTYEISIRPYPDCCSLFVPAHPRTRPTVADAEEAERPLDAAALVQEALDRSERQVILPRWAAPLAVGS
jgi:thiamine biosynthesis protein ThiI